MNIFRNHQFNPNINQVKNLEEPNWGEELINQRVDNYAFPDGETYGTLANDATLNNLSVLTEVRGDILQINDERDGQINEINAEFNTKKTKIANDVQEKNLVLKTHSLMHDRSQLTINQRLKDNPNDNEIQIYNYEQDFTEKYDSFALLPSSNNKKDVYKHLLINIAKCKALFDEHQIIELQSVADSIKEKLTDNILSHCQNIDDKKIKLKKDDKNDYTIYKLLPYIELLLENHETYSPYSDLNVQEEIKIIEDTFKKNMTSIKISRTLKLNNVDKKFEPKFKELNIHYEQLLSELNEDIKKPQSEVVKEALDHILITNDLEELKSINNYIQKIMRTEVKFQETVPEIKTENVSRQIPKSKVKKNIGEIIIKNANNNSTKRKIGMVVVEKEVVKKSKEDQSILINLNQKFEKIAKIFDVDPEDIKRSPMRFLNRINDAYDLSKTNTKERRVDTDDIQQFITFFKNIPNDKSTQLMNYIKSLSEVIDNNNNNGLNNI